MRVQADQQSDRRLLEAVLSFVADHSHPNLRRFKKALADWGQDWVAVPPCDLPMVEILSESLPLASTETRVLLDCVLRERHARRWEQSYTKADGLVGDDMLASYGFAEVIGKLGPFLSTKVRAGIGVWGPNIDYPPHRHQAEEIYIPLAGAAAFRLLRGEALSVETRGVGEAVYVPSMLTHGFHTLDQPLVVLYIWQAGDLRETSRFD
ncbi:MAG: dimethylsulfonioproprionate lyase family protein [Kiloniellales bacterium]